MTRLLLACVAVLIAATAHAQEPWGLTPLAPSPSPLVVPGLPALPDLPKLPSVVAPVSRSRSDFDPWSGNSYRWRPGHQGRHPTSTG